MFKFPSAFYSDVRIEKVFKTLIRFEMGRLEEVKIKNDEGAFIRLYDGSKWYYASTTDLSNINDELSNLAGLATAA